MDRSGPVNCYGCNYRHVLKNDPEDYGEVVCALTMLFPNKYLCYAGESKKITNLEEKT